MDLEALGENTIVVDCDVIQADGGTRTASITGACVALQDAVSYMIKEGMIEKNPLDAFVAAVSVGIYEGEAILDLDYPEDSNAHTDMNVVMTEKGGVIEIQGTAEQDPFSEEEFSQMFALAKKGIGELIGKQKEVLS